MQPQSSRSLLNMPGAVIIAGAIIAIAIIWTHKPAAPVAPSTAQEAASAATASAQTALAPVTSADHILGNPDAPIKIVEFSDPSCPFCKEFNPTMVQVMNQYGPSGKVAWVYRAFPLDKPDASGNMLHPNAGRESEALECAALVGGNDAFWSYEKEWYNVIPDDGAERTADADNAQISQIAKDVGLNQVGFNDCLSGTQAKERIDASYTDGVNAGVAGTPTSIIITPSGTQIPLPGVVSFTTIKSTLDVLLTETK